MTDSVEAIMALADEYANFTADLRAAYGVPKMEARERPYVEDARAALRAAVEQVIRERDACVKEDAIKASVNKMLLERAERAEDNYQGAMLDLKRVEQELAQLKRTVEHMEQTYLREHGGSWGKCQYQDKVERAEQDAARYRWLQREIDLGRLESDNPAVFWAIKEEDGNALDAAIDAAMKEGK